MTNVKLVRVDPTKVRIPDVRVTSQMDPETLEQFKATVNSWGIETPILCFQVDEELVLVDGLHRLQQALDQKLKTIGVVVRPGSMTDVLTRNILLDKLRGKHKVSDMVRVLGHLYKDQGLDPDQIRKDTGLTRDYIEKLIKISEAGPVILEALEDDIIGVGAAYELARLPHPSQQQELLDKFQIYRWPVKELHQFVSDILSQMENIPPETVNATPSQPLPPRMYECQGCKQETEPRNLKAVMICPDCYSRLWHAARAAENNKAEEAVVGEGA